MKLSIRLKREFALWKQYPRDRVRWLLRRTSRLESVSFRFCGNDYPYFIHPYNHTWRNERAVEIPVVWDYLQQIEPEDVLEIGNVLSHYFEIKHQVIDKWEKCIYYDNVVNHDILSWNPTRRFRVIVSISTIEHIGWDEEPRDPEIVFTVFSKLKAMLQPEGTAIITIPIGQNPILDQGLCNGRITVSQLFFLKRTSALNEWEETDRKTALMCRYGHPFPNTNALAFLIIHASRENN